MVEIKSKNLASDVLNFVKATGAFPVSDTDVFNIVGRVTIIAGTDVPAMVEAVKANELIEKGQDGHWKLTGIGEKFLTENTK